MLVKFLDLGSQPIANNFLKVEKISDREIFYPLTMAIDTDTLLVTQETPVDKELMFHENYAYSSSTSKTMQDHFKSIADKITSDFKPKKVLEIGSNDGIFIKNFLNKEIQICGVEPCGNFSKITNDLGIKTFNNFWSLDFSKKIEQDIGKIDVIFSANCMCHIPDLHDAFLGIRSILSEQGVFIFEDPSLVSMLSNNSYDQIYDEHIHIFSLHALKNILQKAGLTLYHVEKLSVHGGSHRVYACKDTADITQTDDLRLALEEENLAGITSIQTYFDFAKRVEDSKNNLVYALKKFKENGKRIISYGATSKSTTVFNYCNLDSSVIDFIVDVTPAKIGKVSPGTHVPIVSRNDVVLGDNDVIFLGAWNFEKEIVEKEKQAIEQGAIFVTHVPIVRTFSKKPFVESFHFNEDDRAQRALDLFDVARNSQINVSFVNSTEHIVAWHGHRVQVDQWVCLKGSFKVGLAMPVPGSNGTEFEVKFIYLSDKNINRKLTIPPGTYHGYKALEPDSVLLYHLDQKYDSLDEIKLPVGYFGESWHTENK